MDKPIVLPLIKKYVETIQNPHAERRFTMLMKEYTDALNEGHRDILSQRIVKEVVETVTNSPASHLTSEEDQFKTIVNHYEQKAQDLASEYIKDAKIRDELYRMVVEETRSTFVSQQYKKSDLVNRTTGNRKSKSNGRG